MPMLARLRSTWRNLARRDAVEAELDREVAAFLALAADEKERAGMSREEARRAARLEHGGAEQVKEEVRAVRAGAFLDSVRLDLRYGARSLRRSPGFTAVAVLALALGIGANSALSSIVEGVLLRPLPYPQPARLVLVSRHFARSNFPYGNLCIADYLDWRAANRSFEDPALVWRRRFDLSGAGEPEQLSGAAVTTGFFSALRVRPLAGRVFAAGEDGPAAPGLAVLSESLWRRRFGGSPSVVGRSVDLDGKPATIVGVMPAGFHFPRPDSEIWTNLRFDPPTRRGPFFYRGLARLRPGVSLAQAQAELAAVARRIELADPRLARLSFPLQPLRDAIVGEARPALLILFGAVTLVLLIAAVNVANLLLARATARQREMAVRLGLGAGRGRLLRQLLTESGLLALLGGAAGVALAAGAVALVRSWIPGDLPRIHEVRLDAPVVAFTLLVSLATGILFGLAPALQGTRHGQVTALRDGGRGGAGGGRGRQRTRAALVVAEIALSLVLLAGAALVLRSFVLLQGVRTGLGVPARRLVSLQVSPSPVRYRDDDATLAFYAHLLERVRLLPGVEAAEVTDSLPPDREGDADTYVVAGRPLGPGETNPIVSAPTVGPDYFRTLGIPLLRGRSFDRRERPASQPVVILSAGMARHEFPGQDPLGQRIKRSGPDVSSPFMTVVGVVGNTRYLGLGNPNDAAYYVPVAQNVDLKQVLVVRTASDAAALATRLRAEVQAADPSAVVSAAQTMEQALADSVAQPRFRTALLGAFAAVALLLAAIGIYGVVAYSVAQRTQEIGVRLALGARRAHILRMIAGQGARLALAGIVLGLGGALAFTRLLANLLYGVSPTDPATYVLVALLLGGVALAASLVPAHRAARIDPQRALKID